MSPLVACGRRVVGQLAGSSQNIESVFTLKREDQSRSHPTLLDRKLHRSTGPLVSGAKIHPNQRWWVASAIPDV